MSRTEAQHRAITLSVASTTIASIYKHPAQLAGTVRPVSVRDMPKRKLVRSSSGACRVIGAQHGEGVFARPL